MTEEDEEFERIERESGWRKRQIQESMKQDEIIEMAQKCGLIGMRPHLDGIYSEALEAFAKRVADKATQTEKERCSKIARLFYQPKYGSLSRIKCTEINPNHIALEIEAAILKVEQA